MADKPRPWTVLQNDPIEKLSANVWTVEGPIPNMSLTRRMTLIKREDGRVVIHNAIALSDEQMGEIERWGEPSELIVPNGWHRMDANAYTQRYKKLRVYCAKQALDRVSQQVRVHGHWADFGAESRLRVLPLDGAEASGEATFVVREESGVTLVFNDVFFNHPHVQGAEGTMMRLLGSTGGPKVTAVAKWMMISDRSQFAATLVTLANIRDLKTLIPGHGTPVTADASKVLAQVAVRV